MAVGPNKPRVRTLFETDILTSAITALGCQDRTCTVLIRRDDTFQPQPKTTSKANALARGCQADNESVTSYSVVNFITGGGQVFKCIETAVPTIRCLDDVSSL